MIKFDAMRAHISFLTRGGKSKPYVSPAPWTPLESDCLEIYDLLVDAMHQREAKITPKAWAFIMLSLGQELKREEKWPQLVPSETSQTKS